MRNIIIVLLTITFIFSGYAQADEVIKIEQNTKTKKCLFPKSKKLAPSWLCNTQDDKWAVTAIGSHPKSKAGIAFMEEMAAAEARVQLVKKLSGTITQKISASETSKNHNTDSPDKILIEKISHASLEGSRIISKAYAPHGRVYVLIGLNQADTDKLHETITLEYLKQKQK